MSWAIEDVVVAGRPSKTCNGLHQEFQFWLQFPFCATTRSMEPGKPQSPPASGRGQAAQGSLKDTLCPFEAFLCQGSLLFSLTGGGGGYEFGPACHESCLNPFPHSLRSNSKAQAKGKRQEARLGTPARLPSQNPLLAAENFCAREQIHKSNTEQIRPETFSR